MHYYLLWWERLSAASHIHPWDKIEKLIYIAVIWLLVQRIYSASYAFPTHQFTSMIATFILRSQKQILEFIIMKWDCVLIIMPIFAILIKQNSFIIMRFCGLFHWILSFFKATIVAKTASSFHTFVSLDSLKNCKAKYERENNKIRSSKLVHSVD